MSSEKKKRGGPAIPKRLLLTIIALVLLIIIDVIKDPSFLHIGYVNGGLNGPLIDVIRDSAPFLMIAVGMTLVISTSGIDLSVGASMAVAGAVAMQFMHNTNGTGLGSALIAIVLALGVCALIGAWNGLLVSGLGLQPFITTLIMMLAGRGIAKTITSGENTSAVNSAFSWIDTGYVLGIPFAFILATLIVLAVAALMRKTALGMMIESVGVNPEASRMGGLKPKRVIFSVYLISAILAGMAGVFTTGNVMRITPSQTGLSYEMDAVLAVVIGGTSLLGGKFSLSGAYLGAMIISLLEKTIVWLGISNAATPAFKAIIVIAICVLQSNFFTNALKKMRSKKQSKAAMTAAREGAAA